MSPNVFVGALIVENNDMYIDIFSPTKYSVFYVGPFVWSNKP